jgi:hypothetical protein
MNARITWLDQDSSVLKLTPAEVLRASTGWSARRSPDQPWLAITKPTSLAEQYFTVSLSLDAFHRYTDPTMQGFVAECESLEQAYTNEEREAMRAEEISKGNAGRLHEAKPGLLRVHVPRRLVPDAKTRIETLFAGAGPIVVETTSD